MRKITLLPLMVLFLGSMQVNPAAASADRPGAEEYGIYSTLLTHLYGSGQTKLLVIQNKTDSYNVSEGAVEQHIAFITHGLPDIRDEVIRNFFARNSRHRLLTNEFEVNFQTEIAAKDDLDCILARDPYRGWEKFYKRYPDSSGVIKLSLIGFDSEMTQAMVYASRACGPACGKGSYFLLKKEGTDWIIAKELILWVL